MKFTTKSLIILYIILSLILCIGGRRSFMKQIDENKDSTKPTDATKKENENDEEITKIDEKYMDNVLAMAKENKMYDKISGILSTIVPNQNEQSIKEEVNKVFPKIRTCTKEYLLNNYKSGTTNFKKNQSIIEKYLNKINEQIDQKKAIESKKDNDSAPESKYLDDEYNTAPAPTAQDEKAPSEIVAECHYLQQQSLLNIQGLEHLKKTMETEKEYMTAIKTINDLIKTKKQLKKQMRKEYESILNIMEKEINVKEYSENIFEKGFGKIKKFWKKLFSKGDGKQKSMIDYDKSIRDIKTKIQETNEKIKTHAITIYKNKKEREKLSKQIEEKKIIAEMNCAKFAEDSKKAYDYGIIKKTFNKIPFYMNVLDCASNSSLFESSINKFKTALKSIVSANVELFTSIMEDPSFATAVEKIKSRAQDACSVLFQLIIVIREKKSKCLFKGMPECAYLQGVINGYVLKLFAAIGGASYK